MEGGEKNEGNELSGELSAEISAEGNIFIAKGGSSVSGTVHASSNTNSIYSRSVNSKIVAVNALRTQKIPLIIDDFHYIEKSVQKAIVRALKSPIMHGLPVIFIAISEHSGRSMFDKLKRGPRARTDRKARKLRNGSVTDIYGLVMEALKNLQPGTESVSYDALRANMRDILDDELPQKHEISRVLDKIAEISYTDASSTPVIDWQSEDGLLTITDPFFAFFLRWS